jgi:alpha-glucosidase
MRRARLSQPPVFWFAARAGANVTLASDAAAVVHVFVLEDDIIRLLLLPDGAVESPPSWAIAPGLEDIAEPGRDRMSVAGFGCPDFALHEADGTLTIETKRLRLEITLNGFHCRWSQRMGDDWRLMAQDRPTQAYDFGWWDGKVHHYVARQFGERYYGLGERSGVMDRAGRRFRLANIDAMGYDAAQTDPLYKSIPYLLTAQPDGTCHGAFYDNMADGFIDLGLELDNYHGPYWHFCADAGDLDLYMIAGPDPLSVTKRFTWLTGKPALMPRWAIGYSGSTMSYTDAPDAQAQMQQFLDKLAEHDIGCSSFHLSSGYTSIGDKRYVFNWNRDKFCDPAGFIDSYLQAGVRLVANIKPALLTDHPQYAALADEGLFVRDPDGAPTEIQYWDALGSAVDFTNPKTTAWWQSQVTSALLDYGIAATWNDNNEYEVWDSCARADGFGTPYPVVEARALQPLLMMRASRAAQIAHAPNQRPYVVTRAGMAGLHRYAQTWTGDNRTSWESLRYNIKMGLGLSLSGVSNIGHDVGGFAGLKPDPELFLRWVQAGIMMPRFSIHSWNDDGSVNEPWMHPEILPQVRKLMALRQRLTPCFYDLMHRYHADYEPISRPLWLDHPQDSAAWAENDDHLLGPNLLVALVVEQGATTRTVRFPGTGQWMNVWTGEAYAGGSTATFPAPLDAPPLLFARAGSGIAVDLGTQGHQPGPHTPGVWLFPPSGNGLVAWQSYNDDGESIVTTQHGSMRVEGECDAPTIALEIKAHTHLDDASPLTIILPRGERRAVRVNGTEVDTSLSSDLCRCFVVNLRTGMILGDAAASG